jgi:hypothetical protein
VIRLLVFMAFVHGIVVIVTMSTLLDGYRRWAQNRLSYDYSGIAIPADQMQAMTPQALADMMSQAKPPKGLSPLCSLILKLINCWICVSFWAGFLLSILCISPFLNPILSGIAAVGLIGFYRIWVDKH